MLEAAIAAMVLTAAAPSMSTPATPMPTDFAFADRQLDDPAAERRASALMQTLRCVVCQGQSIADSDADLARDMRAFVRQRIAAGEGAESVRSDLVARYGQWVSYRPVLDRITWPLWAVPGAMAALGLWLARGRLRWR